MIEEQPPRRSPYALPYDRFVGDGQVQEVEQVVGPPHDLPHDVPSVGDGDGD